MTLSRTVLITGCSSGIGEALAHEFHGRGHRVLATARRIESLRALADKGMTTLALDVADAASIKNAVAELNERGMPVDILVNNAGYGQFGAVMDTEVADLQRQFETNVFGPVAVSRALLPQLRQSSFGRIANIGSISGIVTTPFAGVYCGSKAALHALSDAMRMELAPFGVRVLTIEPGGIASSFGETGAAHVRLPLGSIYEPVSKYVLGRAKASQRGATPVVDFTRDVVDHLLQSDPAPISRYGSQSIRLPLLKRWMPVRMLDRKLQKLFGLDRL